MTVRCHHDMKDEGADRTDEIHGLSPEFLAKGRGKERDQRKPECVHRQTNCCLELGSMQITSHGRETERVCTRRRSYEEVVRTCVNLHSV